MTISSISEYTQQITTALADLSSYLDSPQIEFAANQALDELEWSFPIDSGAKKYWAIQRGKRHAMDLLKTSAAYKFKYKQISLHQRFDHLDRQIKQMDEDFKEAMKNDVTLFGVDAHKIFGTYLDNGFVYDQYGNDVSRLMNDLGIDNEGYRKRKL